MAINFPTDVNVFALVCIDAHNAGLGPKPIDPAIKKEVNDRLQKYCSHWPEFRATSEDPLVLKTVLDLEQIMGREITWVRGIGFDTAIRWKSSIPNEVKRWCTTYLKIIPIFEHVFKYHGIPVSMNMGYRADEAERASHMHPLLKYPVRCEYRPKSMTWIQRWEMMDWQRLNYPMIEANVMRPTVMKFWESKPIEFAVDTNCLMCYWKSEAQLRKNFEANPATMAWSMVMEDMQEYTWKKNMSMQGVKNLGIQQDFFYGGGAGCNSGFCSAD